MKLHRRWRRLLLSFAAFFSAVMFILYSETALRWGVFLVTDILVKPLAVEDVHGRLAGPLLLSGIEYNDTQRQLSLERLALDWKPSRLFTATAHITMLQAKGLNFKPLQQAAKTKTPTGQFVLPQIGFPLKLIIENASLDGMTIQSSAEAKPITVRQITLQAETSLNTLLVKTLRVDSDWGRLTIGGNVRPRQNYRTALNLEWSVPQQNQRPWQGKGTLQGDIHNLRLQQQLTSPFIATLALKGKDLLDELTWNAQLEIPQLQSSQLPFSVTPAFSLNAGLTANGDLDSFNTTGRFAGKVETVGIVEGGLDASYADQKIQLTRLQIHRQEDAARLEASGDIELGTPLRYRLQSTWQTLTWPLAKSIVASEQGQLHVNGEEKTYRFNTELSLNGAQIPSGDWQIEGHGDNASITVSALVGKLLNGALEGTGAFTFSPSLHWQGQLQGRALNPAVMWPQWPGSVAFTAEIRGQQTKKELSLAISLPTLSGTLRGRTLQGKSEAAWRGGVGSLKTLELQLGAAVLQASGRLGEEMALDWQLEAAELEDLWPQADGSLKADGNITGPITTPKIALKLNGHRLHFAAYGAESIRADIALDLQQQAPSSLELHVEQLQLPGFPQQSITLTGRGPLSDHRISLNSHSAKQNLNMDLTAGYAEGRWAGRFNRVQIEDAQLGQWQLAQAAAFSVASSAVHLDELCLRQQTANLCSRADWKLDSHLGADLRSVRFPLDLLQPYLPQRFSVSGELDGRASLELLPRRKPRVDASLTVGVGRFALIDPNSGDTDLALPYQGVALRLDTSSSARIDSELTLSLSERDKLTLALQTSLAGGWPERPLHHPLTGRLIASIEDLEFISSAIPEVQNFHGTLEADIAFAGTVKTPRLNGYARLTGGQLEIPRAGLTLSAIHLSARGDNSTKMEISGGAKSGDGELEIDGLLAPSDTGTWGFELAMSGENFEVARIPEARLLVSPDLKARIIGHEIHLEGEVDIPSARLEPPDISLAVKPSDDVIIIKQDGEEVKSERWLIHTRIRMTAADSIRFIGYGFDGRIGGDLLLVDDPGQVTRGRGQLHVVAGSTYKSFGTKLNTEYGQLNFADSPLDNPNLDIRASRTIGDVIAGINIRGTAKKPILTLYSEPPMDQADILSYITLGHPMNTSGQSEGETLAGAANTAGLIGGNYLAGYIGRQFGLEEASVEADPTTQSPWVVMGTYLSPRLYVRYGVGVYEDAYSIIVRYQLTEHWQLQGEGGYNSGADILYTFER